MPALAVVTCPPVVVLRIAPLAIPEIQRLVVDALVAERFVVVAEVVVEKLMSRPCVKVDDAPLKIICDVVAEIPADGCVKGS